MPHSAPGKTFAWRSNTILAYLMKPGSLSCCEASSNRSAPLAWNDKRPIYYMSSLYVTLIPQTVRLFSPTLCGTHAAFKWNLSWTKPRKWMHMVYFSVQLSQQDGPWLFWSWIHYEPMFPWPGVININQYVSVCRKKPGLLVYLQYIDCIHINVCTSRLP